MRSGHGLALQTVQPSQPEDLTKQEETLTASYPVFPGTNGQQMIMNTLNAKLRDSVRM